MEERWGQYEGGWERLDSREWQADGSAQQPRNSTGWNLKYGGKNDNFSDDNYTLIKVSQHFCQITNDDSGVLCSAHNRKE